MQVRTDSDGGVTPGVDRASAPPTPGVPSEDIDAVPVPHPGRWVATAVVGLLAFALAVSMVTTPRFRWGVVGEYMFSQPILEGVRLTLILTIVAEALGIAIGVVLAIMRLSPNPILSRGAWAYIWFFRGTPLLVQLIFWFNLSALYPEIGLSIPFGPSLFSGNANDLITPFTVAILGLGLNEGAYTAEIVRGGIAGIDRGQSEAAKALGITHLQTLRRIVLPQSMKLIVPPLGNQTILMLKTTSLVSVLALADLLYAAQAIYARTFQTMPLLIVVSLWYLAITSVLTVGQHYLEQHFATGSTQTTGDGVAARWRRNATNLRRSSPPGGRDDD
ncbi:MAG: amino acid ABC transporter permease [Ilumatobacter sp.]